MRTLARLALAAIALGAASAQAEQLTVAVSSPAVQITSNFTGVNLTVFGVIGDPASDVLLEGGYQAAVVVLGPPQSVVERRKDRIVGIWANRAAATIVGAPSFYALDTTGPLETLATPQTLQQFGLGFPNIALSFAQDGTAAPPDPEFRDAFIRLQTAAGLFAQQSGIRFIGDSIFRSTIFLPANIPDGTYTVLAYLFSDQQQVASAQAIFTVSKIGLEHTVASFATGQSLLYGTLTVALSLFMGWLGGVIFRRD